MNVFTSKALLKKLRAKKKANGFTLIELMVVVAIVGVLSAVGLPALTKAQDKAKDSAAIATLTNAAKECSLELVNGATSYTFASNGPFAAVTSTATGNACEPDSTITLSSASGGGAALEANVVFTGAIPAAATLDAQG
jgi:prepilin-type N-terminal cleavage/methylation domain-containing protein